MTEQICILFGLRKKEINGCFESLRLGTVMHVCYVLDMVLDTRSPEVTESGHPCLGLVGVAHEGAVVESALLGLGTHPGRRRAEVWWERPQMLASTWAWTRCWVEVLFTEVWDLGQPDAGGVLPDQGPSPCVS